MKRLSALSIAASALFTLMVPGPGMKAGASPITPPVPTAPCVADKSTLCGLKNPEDLEVVERTPWVIAGGFTPGALYAIDRRTRTVSDLLPGLRMKWNKQRYKGCPGPLRSSQLIAHGLAVEPGQQPKLYVVNHGDREAIEIFDFAPRAGQLTWLGCVLLPENVMGNSVTPLGKGRFAVTNMGHFTPALFGNIAARQNTGDIRIWNPAAGWSILPGTSSSGPNGIAASRDGKTIYYARSGTRDIAAVTLDGRTLGVSPPLSFMPDNLRWGSSGRLLVVGMAETPQTVLKCMQDYSCVPAAEAASLDAASLQSRTIRRWQQGMTAGPLSTVVEVDGRYWLGSFRANRIDIVDPQN